MKKILLFNAVLLFSGVTCFAQQKVAASVIGGSKAQNGIKPIALLVDNGVTYTLNTKTNRKEETPIVSASANSVNEGTGRTKAKELANRGVKNN